MEFPRMERMDLSLYSVAESNWNHPLRMCTHTRESQTVLMTGDGWNEVDCGSNMQCSHVCLRTCYVFSE
jgi:hypothetical protein